MAKNVSARSSWYAPLRASCTGVQSLMLRCFPRSLPRLTCSCPVVEELPGHEIYGEYAKDQQHLQEESTDQGKRQPGDDGAGGFDHVVAGDELRRPKHAVRDQQRWAECGQQRNQGCVHEGLAQAEPAAPLLVLAVVAPQAHGKEARKERAPIYFPVGHGLLLRNTTAELAPHGARIGALAHQNETGQHQHIQADAQQEEEDEVLFLQHVCRALCSDIRLYGRLEPAGDGAFGLLIQVSHTGLEVFGGFVDGVAAEEEDAYDGEQRNDDGGDRFHGGFLSIEQDLDDAHDLSDHDNQEKQQSPVRAFVISWGWLRSVIAPDFIENFESDRRKIYEVCHVLRRPRMKKRTGITTKIMMKFMHVPPSAKTVLFGFSIPCTPKLKTSVVSNVTTRLPLIHSRISSLLTKRPKPNILATFSILYTPDQITLHRPMPAKKLDDAVGVNIEACAKAGAQRHTP